MDAVERQEHCVRFGKELRRIRREAGLSMETLGNRAGPHRTEISHLERAGREPRLTTIMRVAHALDISASHLLKGVDLFGSDGGDAELQPVPLVVLRGPRQATEDPARAGSSSPPCGLRLGFRTATNGASLKGGDGGSLQLG